MRRFAQVQTAGDDVAEDEALDAELIRAVILGEKPGLLERRQQPERGGAGNAGAGREVGEREPRLAEGEDAQQLQRLGRGVHLVARSRDDSRGPFHSVKRYIKW